MVASSPPVERDWTKTGQFKEDLGAGVAQERIIPVACSIARPRRRCPR